ncbi:peptidase C39 [Helicobacter sp. MIT 05-5293]|uniref:C39 family peptidase n=1 Tax=Helicobacter sp. MIT 05-5293 TaxID=1548149 RepID=UPI00051D87A2|nr:C39 family peptidase [Helicobacter sp. MIT 05-5293]TLD80401.1 peptidase C39 [Helicobacter sp. MIT 05-5293]
MRFLFVWGLLCGMCLSDVYMHNESMMLQKGVTSWAEFKDKNLAKQQYDYSCGSASLSTILTYYYGQDVSERDILDSILISKGIDITQKERIESDEKLREKVSFSFTDLAYFAQQKGFKTAGLALDLQSLARLKVPVIIYVNVRDMEHFSVYKGQDSQFVYLADPSFGNMRVSIAKFQEMFYQRKDLTHPGKILVVLPAQEHQKINPDFLTHKNRSSLVYEMIKLRANQH